MELQRAAIARRLPKEQKRHGEGTSIGNGRRDRQFLANRERVYFGEPGDSVTTESGATYSVQPNGSFRRVA